MSITLETSAGFKSNLIFSDNGSMLAFSDSYSDHMHWVQVIETRTGKVLHKFRSSHPKALSHISFSPDNKLIAIVQSYGIELWNLQTGSLFRRLSMPWHEDDDISRTAEFTSKGRSMTIMKLSNKNTTSVLNWSIDSDVLDKIILWRVYWFIAHGSEDPGISILGFWDIANRDLITIRTGAIVSFALSVQHGLIACDLENSLLLYDAITFKLISTTPLDNLTKEDRRIRQVSPSVVFSPLDPLVFRAGSLLDISDKKNVTLLPQPVWLTADVSKVAFFVGLSQQNIATASSSLIELWPSRLPESHKITPGQAMSPELSISPDGSKVISIGSWEHKSVKICLNPDYIVEPLAHVLQDVSSLSSPYDGGNNWDLKIGFLKTSKESSQAIWAKMASLEGSDDDGAPGRSASDRYKWPLWIDVDPENSTIMVHNNLGIRGSFEVAVSQSLIGGDPQIELTQSDAQQADEYRLERLKELIPHPVFSYGADWIYNHMGTPILWVDYKAIASKKFLGKWRWTGNRLVIAGDCENGIPFVFDFLGVDVTLPRAVDTYRTLQPTIPLSRYIWVRTCSGLSMILDG
ncbi:hypothetical protein H0H81_007083 [Sphagnurus paluster]|uniref:Uncharacterized protein n=1 Tax=Sphagnurus paluster TaxID=117069 RepID=A0A9P7K3G5_9AGAR|nr:hypothetical protein H0H81_007083 [Sphagnurus paluster]